MVFFRVCLACALDVCWWVLWSRVFPCYIWYNVSEVSRQAGSFQRRLTLNWANYTAGVRQKSRFEVCYTAM